MQTPRHHRFEFPVAALVGAIALSLLFIQL